jgi:hypothetical protein
MKKGGSFGRGYKQGYKRRAQVFHTAVPWPTPIS